MNRLTAGDLADSQAAGATFAQQILVGMTTADLPQGIIRTVGQVTVAAQEEGYTPSEIAEVLHAFVAGARAESRDIARTLHPSRWHLAPPLQRPTGLP